LETIATIDGAVIAGLERYLGLITATSTDGCIHLTLLTETTGAATTATIGTTAITTLRFAIGTTLWATCRFVCQTTTGKKLLLSSRERELSIAVPAIQRFICK
jgi:hypothetical protein